MKCPHCETLVQKDDKYCLNCGAALEIQKHNPNVISKPDNEILPAEQADQLLKEAKRIVKHLSREEQVIGGAALIAFISFFLPWFENFSKSQNGFAIAAINNWVYLVLVAIFASWALLYVGQGAKKSIKIFYTSIHAVVGTFIFASEFITYGFGSSSGISLLIVSGAVMTITSLYYQKKLLTAKE